MKLELDIQLLGAGGGLASSNEDPDEYILGMSRWEIDAEKATENY